MTVRRIVLSTSKRAGRIGRDRTRVGAAVPSGSEQTAPRVARPGNGGAPVTCTHNDNGSITGERSIRHVRERWPHGRRSKPVVATDSALGSDMAIRLRGPAASQILT